MWRVPQRRFSPHFRATALDRQREMQHAHALLPQRRWRFVLAACYFAGCRHLDQVCPFWLGSAAYPLGNHRQPAKSSPLRVDDANPARPQSRTRPLPLRHLCPRFRHRPRLVSVSRPRSHQRTPSLSRRFVGRPTPMHAGLPPSGLSSAATASYFSVFSRQG